MVIEGQIGCVSDDDIDPWGEQMLTLVWIMAFFLLQTNYLFKKVRGYLLSCKLYLIIAVDYGYYP